MAHDKQKNLYHIIIGILIAGGIFVEDIFTPLGVADGVIYVGLVLLTLFTQGAQLTFLAGIVSTILTALGYLLSPTSGSVSTALTNRIFAVVGIWVAVFVILRFKKYQEMLLKNKESLDALFRFATEGIIITDKKGNIVMANPAAEKLFGYGHEELNGKAIEILIPQKLSKLHIEHREKFYEHPASRNMGQGRDLYGRRKDGSEFPVEIGLTHYYSGEELFVTAFIVDITPRKRAEEKLKSYNIELEKQVSNRTKILHEAINELESAKEELEISLEKEKELSDLKSRFVSMASHEFRTPLSTILSSVALVGKYNKPDEGEKRNKHIARIKSSVNNLTDILNDFLSVSKLEEGKIANNPEPFDVPEFSEDVAQEMQAVAKETQKIIYTHEGENKNTTLDKKLLRNILINLLSNAIKFSSEGKEIYFNTKIKDSEFAVAITDKGIGISEEDQKHLFERFFRGENATYIQGTGLGLNIVMKYLELIGGNIQCKSKLNEGTTWILTFPI